MNENVKREPDKDSDTQTVDDVSDVRNILYVFSLKSDGRSRTVDPLYGLDTD